jgi:hypothetical protein
MCVQIGILPSATGDVADDLRVQITGLAGGHTVLLLKTAPPFPAFPPSMATLDNSANIQGIAQAMSAPRA